MTSIQQRTGGVVDRPGEFWRAPAVAEKYESRRFDSVRGRLYRWREERAIEQALSGLREGSTVLDAPCGTGRLLTLAQRRRLRPTGCDISIAMMTVARAQLTSHGCAVPLVATNIQHLPYADKSFDAAICVGLLMHLDADARAGALGQLARVARERVVVQYGCLHGFNRARAWMTGHSAGSVKYPVLDREMRTDFERAGLRERARFWVLRGISSSVVVVLTP